MIKKIFISLLVLLGFGLSFSNAGYSRQVGVYGVDPFDQTVDINVISKGTLMSSLVGETKRLFWIKEGNYFMWDYNNDWNGVYMYSVIDNNGSNNGYQIKQGFVSDILVCNSAITGVSLSFDIFNTFGIGGCTRYNQEGNNTLIKNLVNSITSSDYFGFDYTTSSACTQAYICLSSSEYNRTICFGNSVKGTSSPRNNCFPYFDSYYGTYNGGNVTGSNNYSTKRSNISPNYSSPAVDGSINGGSNTVENVGLSGNLSYNVCSNGYVLAQIDNLYGSDSFSTACHAGIGTGLEIDGTLITESEIEHLSVPGNGITFKELYKYTSNGLSWNKWYNSNMDAMRRYKLGQVGVNPFLSEDGALYSYFYILWNKGFDGLVTSYDVLNYCQLKLFSDYSAPYSGSYFKNYCDNLNSNSGGGTVITGEVGDIDDDEILPPGFDDGGSSSSGVAVSVDWSGTLSGADNRNLDGTTFINEFYQKLQSNFRKPINSLTGIIPGYILIFLFAIVLFRFLSH